MRLAGPKSRWARNCGVPPSPMSCASPSGPASFMISGAPHSPTRWVACTCTARRAARRVAGAEKTPVRVWANMVAMATRAAGWRSGGRKQRARRGAQWKLSLRAALCMLLVLFLIWATPRRSSACKAIPDLR